MSTNPAQEDAFGAGAPEPAPREAGARGPYEPYSAVWYSPANPPSFEILDPSQFAGDAATLGAGEQAPSQRERTFVWGAARELAETLLLAALIFLTVRASFQNFRVEGLSMSPSLDTGQYLVVNKLAYATVDTSVLDWLPFYDSGDNPMHHIFGAPSRGDIVVFKAPDTPERDFIKRIIGVPGDTIEIDRATGGVHVNGRLLDESYVQGRTVCGNGLAGCGPWVVPEGYYFALGDNRQNSTDSRTFGFISESNIIGKALFSYWPPDNFGLAPNHSVSAADGGEP